MSGGVVLALAMRRHLAAVILLTIGGVLAACSSGSAGPTPSTSSPVTTTASASPSPTAAATPPVAPAAEPTSASAEAFVRYFWNVYNYAYAELDAKPLASISASTCKFCTGAAREVSELRKLQKRTTGGEIKPGVVAAPPGDLTKGVIVTMVLDQEPGQTLNRDNSISSSLAAVHNMRSEIALSWRNSAWLVYAVANDEKTGTP